MGQHLQESIFLDQDRQDLLALLEMRFGKIPPAAAGIVNNINKSDVLQRLILVAANAAEWSVFMEELQTGDEAFKLAGERFSPL